MKIFIEKEYVKEYTKLNRNGIYIETISDRPPTSFLDIIAVDDNPISENSFELRNDLFEAYRHMKKDKEEYEKLHYKVTIDKNFAKKFLYNNYIEYYGIIDNITEDVEVQDNNIFIKYKLHGEDEKEVTLYDGYELLRKWRLDNIYDLMI